MKLPLSVFDYYVITTTADTNTNIQLLLLLYYSIVLRAFPRSELNEGLFNFTATSLTGSYCETVCK